jgi:hypothetical protein
MRDETRSGVKLISRLARAHRGDLRVLCARGESLVSAACGGKKRMLRNEQPLGQVRTVTSGAQGRASSRRAQAAMGAGSLTRVLGE